MIKRGNNQKARRLTVSEAIKPNPVLVLFIFAVAFVLAAIFIYGTRGKYPNPDVSDLLRTIGVGVLAAAVAMILDRQILFREIREQIRDTFREMAGVTDSLHRLGIAGAHNRLDFGLPFREAQRGETVCWLDTYCPEKSAFIGDIYDAIKRGVEVRMMIIDPGSANARFRNLELKRSFETGDGWIAGLNSFIKTMSAAARKGGGGFEIRFYDDLPCVPMYLVGEWPACRKGYFSIFLDQPTAYCQHLELGPGEWLAGMSAYFEEKWIRNATNAINQLPRDRHSGSLRSTNLNDRLEKDGSDGSR
jgi:hypothetical protein